MRDGFADDVPPWVKKLVGTPILWWKRRELARFRAQARAARVVQERQLVVLLDAIRGSAFAKDHGLDAVRTPDALRRALPIAPYERVAPYVERVAAGEPGALFTRGTELLMLALTSGTTAAAKLIPVTRRSLVEYRTSWTVWGCGVAEAHPAVPFAGVLNLASDWRGERAPGGLPIGSISGLLFEAMHGVLGATNVAPPAVTRAASSEARLYLALRLALARADTMMVTTANPSTLVQLGRDLDAWKGDLLRDLRDGTLRDAASYPEDVRSRVAPMLARDRRARVRDLEARIRTRDALLPRDAWPRLALLGVWTGGTLTSYLRKLPDLYGPVPYRDHGLSASEGRMTIPLADGDDAGVLNVAGAFYEFVPASAYVPGGGTAPTLLAHELREGERYYMIVTTSGGLVRYDLADCVECAGFVGEAPRLRFLHKGSQIANVTGEKLSMFQVTQAAARTAARARREPGAGEAPLEWALVPDAAADPAGYVLLVERAPAAAYGDERLREWARALDEELARANVEYADKRRSRRLAPVAVATLADGAFAALREGRVARAGGAAEQYKHPFLIADHALAARLLAAAARPHPGQPTQRSG